MVDSDSERKNRKGGLRFLRDFTLVIVGMFLTFGAQSITEYLKIVYPPQNANYYLVLAIGCMVFAVIFLIISVKYSAETD